MTDTIDGSGRAVDSALAALRDGARRWAATGFGERGRALLELLPRLRATADRWVTAACGIKQVPGDAPGAVAEEIGGGPLSVARWLRLMAATHRCLLRGRLPPLPGRIGAQGVPVFPTRSMLDRWLYRGYRGFTEIEAGDGPVQAPPPQGAGTAGVALVLGAGNVTSLPVCDALEQVFARGRGCLLKVHPLHRPLVEVFAELLEPLVRRDVLRLLVGDATLAGYAAHHELVDAVHLTGSAATERALRDGPPPLRKELTTELGGVSPVLVLPGRLDRRELQLQAENVATMVVNNTSFNCIAAQLLVTWRDWPQRVEFLDAVDSVLHRVPTRVAWYPGAAERFPRFCPGVEPRQGHLPWTLLRDGSPGAPWTTDELFAPALCELPLAARDPEVFAEEACRLLAEQVHGNLGATVIAPRGVDPRPGIAALPFGTVGVNAWCGVSYPLMSTPWGGYPGGVSGDGFVHNPYLLRRPRRTVLWGPPRPRPRPPWFVGHPRAEPCVRALAEYYATGSPVRLLAALGHAVRGG